MKSSNTPVGSPLPADQIIGRVSLLEPVYTDAEQKTQDHNDGTWWLIRTHLSEMFHGTYKAPVGSKMPRFDQFNTTSAIIVGNEDSPDQIWLTCASPVNYNSRFWRVA